MKALSEYNPYGPKEDSYKKYQTINFIEENLSGIESAE